MQNSPQASPLLPQREVKSLKLTPIQAPEGVDFMDFEELYQHWFSRIDSYVMSLCKQDRNNADDLLQDACVRGLVKFESLEEKRRFLAWFLKIITNINNDRLKRKHSDYFEQIGNRKLEVMDCRVEGREPVETMAFREFQRDTRMMVRILPRKDAALLNLSEQGLSRFELAEVNRLSVGTMRMRLSRIRNFLRECLEDHGLEPIK